MVNYLLHHQKKLKHFLALFAHGLSQFAYTKIKLVNVDDLHIKNVSNIMPVARFEKFKRFLRFVTMEKLQLEMILIMTGHLKSDMW